ncbi:MAG: hypothetical protein WAS56_11405, partial [Saprospiraceae bacterium]
MLYKLLNPVNEYFAKIMVLLASLSVPIFFLNVQNEITILSLINDTNNRFGFFYKTIAITSYAKPCPIQ